MLTDDEKLVKRSEGRRVEGRGRDGRRGRERRGGEGWEEGKGGERVVETCLESRRLRGVGLSRGHHQ